MNHVFNNLTDSLSEEFKKFDLDEVVHLSISKLAKYDLQINNLVKYNKSQFFKKEYINYHIISNYSICWFFYIFNISWH